MTMKRTNGPWRALKLPGLDAGRCDDTRSMRASERMSYVVKGYAPDFRGP